MSQVTTGLFSALSKPWVYDLFQNLVGANSLREVYTREYIAITGTKRVLDIGCGTAEILNYLPPSIDYFGFDASAQYIGAAKARFGGRGKFFCQYVNEISLEGLGEFDVVMANGLLHHLNDDEVLNLGLISLKVLRPGGRMITHDPCYSDDQGRFARFIISRDRGQNVRSGAEYAGLLRPLFNNVQCEVRHDLLRIPYTHAIMIASKKQYL